VNVRKRHEYSKSNASRRHDGLLTAGEIDATSAYIRATVDR
jgi:hypothetical protein